MGGKRDISHITTHLFSVFVSTTSNEICRELRCPSHFCQKAILTTTTVRASFVSRDEIPLTQWPNAVPGSRPDRASPAVARVCPRRKPKDVRGRPLSVISPRGASPARKANSHVRNYPIPHSRRGRRRRRHLSIFLVAPQSRRTRSRISKSLASATDEH
jgi:hypothetical protein